MTSILLGPADHEFLALPAVFITTDWESKVYWILNFKLIVSLKLLKLGFMKVLVFLLFDHEAKKPTNS